MDAEAEAEAVVVDQLSREVEEWCDHMNCFADIEEQEQNQDDDLAALKDEVRHWQRLRDRLRARERDVEVQGLKSDPAIEAQATNLVEPSTPASARSDQLADELEEQVTALQALALDVESKRAVDLLAIRRIQQQAVVGNILSKPDAELSQSEAQIKRMLQLQDQRMTELNSLASQLDALNDELDRTRVLNADAVEMCRHCFGAEHVPPPAAKADQANLKRLANNLKAQKTRYAIIKNVFQGLVLGGGVDWMSDPALMEVMTSHAVLDEGA